MQTGKNEIQDVLQSRTEINEVMPKQAAEQITQQRTSNGGNVDGNGSIVAVIQYHI